MSAERFEISEGELDVLAITGPEGTRYIDGEEIEARAIRQQARDLEQLRAELAAAVAERDEWKGCAMSNLDERDTLRARLAAIDTAPTVARVSGLYAAFVPVWMDESGFPPIGTELIARPAKDSQSAFEETARSVGIRFDDIENHENQP